MHAVLAIDARDLLGESPVWDDVRQRFLWVDQAGGVVHAASASSRGNGQWQENWGYQLNRPLAAVVPRLRGGLVIGSGIEVLLLDESSGATQLFVALDADPGKVTLNEMKCDPRGRLWAGTRGNDVRERGLAALYRIDPDRTITRVLTGVSVSNGLDWSPDGTTLYYIDSPTFSVVAFEVDVTRGTLTRRRTVVTFSNSSSIPDGMTVDREGYLWVAIAGTGQVRRYSPAGLEVERITISAPVVTSCAFGGPDGGDLWITSAALRLPDEVLATIGASAARAESWAAAPGAGGVFACRPGVSGAAPTAFAG